MARLDRLIQVMYEQRGDALRLAVGKPATLLANGSARPLTRDPLTDVQILALAREVSDAEVGARLGSAASLSFPYQSPSGPVTIALTRDGTAPLIEVRASGPAVTPAGAGPAAAASPVAVTGRSSAELAEARAALDVLFRRLVDAGASDLHLRSGEPPLLRLHGELVREELPAIPAERLELLLLSIMTPREVGEFREMGDTDWAYEIADLARFRCNAGRDRHGPMAVFRVIPAVIRTADEMGLSREVQNLCYLTKGLVVVTGPTG